MSPSPTAALPIITIPRLGVVAPVYDRGLDATGNMLIANGYAVTHYTFSAPVGQRGNYVLYGHDDIEGSIFASLPSMQPGDAVYISQGTRRYTYRVTGSLIVRPTDVDVLRPTPDAVMTIISCTPYMVDTHRIVVRARLVTGAHGSRTHR